MMCALCSCDTSGGVYVKDKQDIRVGTDESIVSSHVLTAADEDDTRSMCVDEGDVQSIVVPGSGSSRAIVDSRVRVLEVSVSCLWTSVQGSIDAAQALSCNLADSACDASCSVGSDAALTDDARHAATHAGLTSNACSAAPQPVPRTACGHLSGLSCSVAVSAGEASLSAVAFAACADDARSGRNGSREGAFAHDGPAPLEIGHKAGAVAVASMDDGGSAGDGVAAFAAGSGERNGAVVRRLIVAGACVAVIAGPHKGSQGTISALSHPEDAQAFMALPSGTFAVNLGDLSLAS